MRSAIAVHRDNHLLTDLVFSSDAAPAEPEISRYREAARTNEIAVTQFYDATRRSFGLRRLADENEPFWHYGDPHRADQP
jgi:hypothetical protein